MGDHIYTNVQGPQPTTLDFVLDQKLSGPGVKTFKSTMAPLNLNTLTERDICVKIAFGAYHLASVRKSTQSHTFLNILFSSEAAKQESDLSLSLEPAQDCYLRIRNGDEIIPCSDARQALEYLRYALKVHGIRDPTGMYRSIYQAVDKIVNENPMEEKRS